MNNETNELKNKQKFRLQFFFLNKNILFLGKNIFENCFIFFMIVLFCVSKDLKYYEQRKQHFLLQ